jgi:hypothetical protein
MRTSNQGRWDLRGGRILHGLFDLLTLLRCVAEKQAGGVRGYTDTGGLPLHHHTAVGERLIEDVDRLSCVRIGAWWRCRI